ncbi:MAG: methyltransferase [Polyangia bacterium]
MITIEVARVEALLQRLYLGDGAPRNEERKKAREVADLLTLVAQLQPQPAPRGKPRLLVDGAAGHGYVGLCAAVLLGWRRVTAIERDPRRAARVRAAATGLDIELEVRDAALQEGIPDEADIVVALHACGAATDALLDGATQARARWIVCAPCCYGVQIPGYAAALSDAERYGDATLAARHAALSVDARRLDRLRAAGYEASLRSFTAPTVTPHHVAFVARRGGGQPKTSA